MRNVLRRAPCAMRHSPCARCRKAASTYHSLLDPLANCSISTQSSSAHAEERVNTGVESGELLWRLLSVNVFHLFKSLIVTFISVQTLTRIAALILNKYYKGSTVIDARGVYLISGVDRRHLKERDVYSQTYNKLNKTRDFSEYIITVYK